MYIHIHIYMNIYVKRVWYICVCVNIYVYIYIHIDVKKVFIRAKCHGLTKYVKNIISWTKCIYIYKFIHVPTYIYIYIYVHVYIYIYICTYLHIWTRIYKHIYVYIFIWVAIGAANSVQQIQESTREPKKAVGSTHVLCRPSFFSWPHGLHWVMLPGGHFISHI